MNAPAQIFLKDGWRLDTRTQVGRKDRVVADWIKVFVGGFGRSALGRALGREATADYSEKKTFHVCNDPRARWRLAAVLST